MTERSYQRTIKSTYKGLPTGTPQYLYEKCFVNIS